MSTLLLRLAAPLQSWGSESKFERRTTGREPTKSGVVGLLAAALGRRRNEAINDLALLKFGVRTDKPGQVMVDFHTAKSAKSTYVTRRYYLEDAAFLVGLEGDADFLHTLQNAIESPFFPLFLGRRSCPPTGRICLGIRNLPLIEALQQEPLITKDKNTKTDDFPLFLDTAQVGFYRQQDLPVSFDPQHRKFKYRYVESYSQQHVTTHDAFERIDE